MMTSTVVSRYLKVAAWTAGAALVAFGLSGFAVAFVNQQAELERLRTAARATEAAHLRAKGLIVGERASRHAWERRARQSEEFLAEVEDELLDQYQLMSTFEFQTESLDLAITIDGPNITVEVPTTLSPGEGSAAGRDTGPTEVGAGGPVRLDLGFDFKGFTARWETEAGNIFAAGYIDVHLTRPQDQFLKRLAFREDASNLSFAPPDPESCRRGWGVGPGFGASSGGALAGLTALTPEWTPNVWRWRPIVQPVLTAAGGSEDGLIFASAVARW